MSKIDDLMKKYCPNGVEYKKIKEVFTRLKGTPITATRMKEIECEGGEIRIFAGGKTVIDAKEKDIPNANITRVPAVLVQSRGVIDFIYYEKPFTFKNEMWAYTSDNKISVKYLFYVLKNNSRHFREAASGMGALPQISLSATEDFVIPVPPLEVQREIVQVLDSFTMLTAELTAELSARKKQYEYYRDQLLSFNNVRGVLTFANPESVRWMTLGEIGKVSMCKRILKSETSAEGEVPFFKIGTFGGKADAYISYQKYEEYKSKYSFPKKGDVLISAAGTIGRTVVYDGKPAYFQDSNIVWIDNDESIVLNSFLNYCYKTQPWKASEGGTIARLYNDNIARTKIPVPPIEIQNRIVKVLDNFDSICSDLQIGLPAEIDARKKQYEYYRDLLLSFEPIGTVLAKQASKQAIISLYQYVYGYVEVMLGEVATISRGGNFQKKDFAESGVPCIHYGQIYTRYGLYADKTISSISNEAAQKQKFAQPNDIVMAVTSENVEDVCKCVAWVGNEPIAVSGHSAIIHHNQNAKFLTYYFHTSMFFEQKRKLAHGTKVIEVTPDKLSDIKIPLPSLAEQERIVAVLDKFDALVNDLSEGLPAEIEARKRQYEYYRDKLLTRIFTVNATDIG